METETLDRLFLEIGQFTKAKLNREIALEKQVEELCDALRELYEGAKAGRDVVAMIDNYAEKFLGYT